MNPTAKKNVSLPYLMKIVLIVMLIMVIQLNVSQKIVRLDYKGDYRVFLN